MSAEICRKNSRQFRRHVYIDNSMVSQSLNEGNRPAYHRRRAPVIFLLQHKLCNAPGRALAFTPVNLTGAATGKSHNHILSRSTLHIQYSANHGIYTSNLHAPGEASDVIAATKAKHSSACRYNHAWHLNL